MEAKPEISIITVTYLSERHVLPLIASVMRSCKGIFYEHIIVDNGSTDQTLSLLSSFEGQVDIIPLNTNVGFSAANLIGYKQARGQFLLFLNPDMEIFGKEGEMARLLAWLKPQPDVGIASCKLVDAKQKINHEALPRRFPRLIEQLAILLKLDKIFPKLLDSYLYKDLDFSKTHVVDSVRGSFMLMPRPFIETVGWPFDPRYFIWFEDVDICREAKKHGFKVVYTPIISCKDSIGQSFNRQRRSWRFRQYAKSLFIYFKKWEPFTIWGLALTVYMPLAFFLGSKPVGKLSTFFKRQ